MGVAGGGAHSTAGVAGGGAQAVAPMTIHGLRGTVIIQAQRLGIPIATVAAVVGHESPLTTLRHYTAPTRAEVAEAAARVSEWIACRG